MANKRYSKNFGRYLDETVDNKESKEKQDMLDKKAILKGIIQRIKDAETDEEASKYEKKLKLYRQMLKK